MSKGREKRKKKGTYTERRTKQTERGRENKQKTRELLRLNRQRGKRERKERETLDVSSPQHQSRPGRNFLILISKFYD